MRLILIFQQNLLDYILAKLALRSIPTLLDLEKKKDIDDKIMKRKNVSLAS